MMRARVDLVSLIAGLALALLGALLLADQLHALSLSFAYFAPAFLATFGVILVARGLQSGRHG